MSNNPPPPPDTTRLAVTAAACAAASARHKAHIAAREEAEAAHDSASADLDAAIKAAAAGKESKLSIDDALEIVRTASARVDLARRLEDATADVVENARRDHVQADQFSWSPIRNHRIEGRIAAAEKYEAGLAICREAIQESDEATRYLREAVSHGHEIPFDGALLAPTAHHFQNFMPAHPGDMHRSLRSAADEKALWGRS